MTGVCGICGSTGPFAAEAVARMNHRLHHRGPDDAGAYIDKGAGLAIGARRLSIIDVEGGHQPLANEDGTVWAALNGEIYNHPELRERLRQDGHRFASGTDTEILVHAYERYGDDLVHELEGMFAFAVWDVRRRRLIIARDRFGEKPLYYTEAGGALTFASELTALRAGCPAPLDIDPGAIDAFFVMGYVPGPETAFSKAKQLPPGHVLTWEWGSAGVRVRPYWEPPVARGDRREPVEVLVAETQRTLERSVAARLISDVPLGVFLSGGIDSTLVAATAARLIPGRLKTFTVGYDTGSVSELEPARVAAGVLGSDHHECVLTSSDVAERVPRVLSALDQPLADEALVAMHAVAEFARRDVTVVVGGEGADELFCGYGRYRWLARADRLHRVAPAPALAAANSGAAVLGDTRRGRRLRDLLTASPTEVRSASWVSAGRSTARQWLYGERLAHASRSLQRIVGPPAGNHRACVVSSAMRWDQRVWLPDDVLMKGDRASMLVSLEVRTPYLDRGMVELASSIPISVHSRGGGKFLLRETLARLVPDEIARRRKVAFRTPTDDWLRGPLRPLVQDYVLSGPLVDDGWFDRAALAQVAERHMAGRENGTRLLWPALTLGLWLSSLGSSS